MALNSQFSMQPYLMTQGCRRNELRCCHSQMLCTAPCVGPPASLGADRHLFKTFKAALGVSQDYLVAQGRSGDGTRFCYSQDGIKWVDLEALPEAAAEKAATVNTQLSGEPSKTYPVTQPGAPMPVADAVGAGLGDGYEMQFVVTCDSCACIREDCIPTCRRL